MWTRLTVNTKKGLAAIKKVGAAIDRQFNSDPDKYWADFWLNVDRRYYLGFIRNAFNKLNKAEKKKAPLPEWQAFAKQLQDNGYHLGNVSQKSILFRSKCATPAADELRGILKADMFERVFLDQKKVFCITHPIIITAKSSKEQFAMGRYCIKWSYSPLAMTDQGTLRFPAHANLQSNHYTHPHIGTSGGYCAGDLMTPLITLFKGGLLADAMGLILQYLATGEGHPYQPLDYWRQGGSASAKPVCASCHYERVVRACRYCFATVCENCRKSYFLNCPRCGHKLTLTASKARKVKTDVKEKKTGKTARTPQ